MFKLMSLLSVLILVGVFSIQNSETSNSDLITLEDGNFVVFEGQVDQSSVASAEVALGEVAAKLGKNDIIYLVLNTPGGSVSAGNQFVDFGKSLPQKIKPLVIFAASMGYHFTQSFDERLILPSGILMSHRASLGGLSGQVPGELETRLAAIKDILLEMDKNAAKRTSMTLEQYRALIHDELWLNGKSAVAGKHADRVVRARCSSDLLTSTQTQTVTLPLFGPVEITVSKCPLITGVLSARLARGNNAQIPGINERMLIDAANKAKRTYVKSEY